MQCRRVSLKEAHMLAIATAKFRRAALFAIFATLNSARRPRHARMRILKYFYFYFRYANFFDASLMPIGAAYKYVGGAASAHRPSHYLSLRPRKYVKQRLLSSIYIAFRAWPSPRARQG